MATRARIGIKLADERVKSIYHHWDGYPEWLGEKLKKYDTEEKIHELMSHGDISCIESETDWNGNELETPIILSYKMRGEDCPAIYHFSVNWWKHTYRNSGIEWLYLFENGEWHCYSTKER